VPGEEAVFELVHPPCAKTRREDIEEVRAMLDAGEIDVAVDELRWLLAGCHALVEAHRLLGQIALESGDVPLGRAHFGRGYELGTKALPPDGLRGTLPSARDANRAFFASGNGLIECLRQLGELDRAAEIAHQLAVLDPSWERA
jgi:hypothetical protein